jgi:hypothetical protein
LLFFFFFQAHIVESGEAIFDSKDPDLKTDSLYILEQLLPWPRLSFYPLWTRKGEKVVSKDLRINWRSALKYTVWHIESAQGTYD